MAELKPIRLGVNVDHVATLRNARGGRHPDPARAAAAAVAAGDNGTRELLEAILVDEEDHADWLETQLTLISQVGESHYLAQQIR